jgi:2-methylcitrate dehydratase PrpD
MPAATVPFLARAGAFVAASSSAPLEVRARLRVQMAGLLAAVASAPPSPIDRWALRASGPHPLLGTGATTARMEAIVGSVARARALDADDFALVGRPAAAAIVPLLLGAPANLLWSEIEAAQLAGVEVGLRAGIATVLRSHGFADPSSVSAVGSAAAASRILGLDAEATASALGRAASHEGTDHGESALAGVLAAELAYEGRRDPTRIPADFEAHAFDDLGRAWVSGTLHPKAHAAPAHAQTAMDAAHEVTAQAHAILRRPLRAQDVATIELETTMIGAANGSNLREHVRRAFGFAHEIRVSHAWELTSELLWRVLSAYDFAPMVKRTSLRRALAELDVGAATVTHLVTEVPRLLSRRTAIDAERALRAFSFPLATRLTVVLTPSTANGARLRAERTTPRGAPDAPIDEARAIAREKLRALGKRRLAEMVLDPPRSLRVGDVLAAM